MHIDRRENNEWLLLVDGIRSDFYFHFVFSLYFPISTVNKHYFANTFKACIKR